MNSPAPPGRPRAVTAARALASILASAVVAMGSVVFTAGAAQAAITTFSLSPQSGAPGTVVHVSGSGCAPGLLSSPGTDYVTVSPATLGFALQIPVASNGSWQGSFNVPANAPALPTALLALCTSGGLPSLFTIYTPQTFSVSAATASTTLPAATTTLPLWIAPPLPTLPPPLSINPAPTTPTTTPTTAPRSGGGGGSDGPKPTTRPPRSLPGTKGTVPGTIAIGTPGDVALPAAGGSPSGTAAGSGSRTVSAVGTRPSGRAGSALLPADLRTASLAADSAPSPGGLGWLVWALLAAVVGAGVATPALLRSRRRRGIAEPVGEPM